MTRAEIAYLLLVLFTAVVLAWWILTYRFVQYRRALQRGERRAKPVWKPFWMN